MKNRDYKIFRSGGYYHVYNRGNNGSDIFLDQGDFSLFLNRLKENLFGLKPIASKKGKTRKVLPAGAFTLVSYCLMSNHFHLLLRQNTDLDISKLILKVCTGYGMYFNKKYERYGHVFQDQFKSIPVQNDEYLVWLSAYIHANPFFLVQDLSDYRWSSFSEYLKPVLEGLCDTGLVLDFFKQDREKYKKFVLESVEKIRERKDIQDMLLE